VTSAPARASVRAVSTPIPEEAPVTTALVPERSIASATSSAVLVPVKAVVIRGGVMLNLHDETN
jgi:hypothetical protein